MAEIAEGRSWIKKQRFSEGQIIRTPKQYEAGSKIDGDLCREDNVSPATFYVWNAKYDGLQVNQAQELLRLSEENSNIRRVVADLTLENVVCKDLFAKTGSACSDENCGELHDRAVPHQ